MDTIPVPVTLTVRGFSCRVGTPPQAVNAKATTTIAVKPSSNLDLMIFSFLKWKRTEDNNPPKPVPLNFTPITCTISNKCSNRKIHAYQLPAGSRKNSADRVGCCAATEGAAGTPDRGTQ